MAMEQQELIESGVADIASSMGFAEDKEAAPVLDPPAGDEAPPDDKQPDDVPAAEPHEGDEAPPDESPEVIPPPKSWAKDTHEIWSKVPPEAQKQFIHREEQMLAGIEQYREFHGLGKSLNDVIAPYRPMLAASGTDPAKAVAVLLNANYRLTQGSAEARKQAFIQLGASLGIIPAQNVPQEPPAVREMRERLERLEGSLTQRQQQAMEEHRVKVSSDVQEFSKTAPYFDEVADDIVAYINAGHDLKAAYDKAVWANPITRAKEQARIQTEAQAKAREKAKGEVQAARRSTAANVRGRDTARSLTEPKGKFLDERTMTEDLREIKARAH